MPFMNEHEIDEAVRRFDRGDTPNLLAGAEALDRLCRWTNSNSDGWAYWKLPLNAARKLMELLQAADRFDPTDCTEAQLKAALVPIKSFLTKRGVDHAAIGIGVPPPITTPLVSLERNNAGDIFIGLTEYDGEGYGVHSCVLVEQREGLPADRIMRSRFEILRRLMPGCRFEDELTTENATT